MDELTILFYFASDNPLAPLVISEIKAIKDAGFQKDTNVLVYFDPMENGAPTQLFDVNRVRKEGGKFKTFIGDGRDPFVRNMKEDLITELPKSMAGRALSNMNAVDSLNSFISFALDEHPAKNYMLFLVGHGMLVGNDAFLPDDDTESAITLKQLRTLCEKFNPTGGETPLRLLALHSCSMSSIELAYELRGTAHYMMGTQGTVFVNGWPIRQLLKKTFNHIRKVKEPDPKEKGPTRERVSETESTATVNYHELFTKLHFLCMHNFTDFNNAGYSCDLALCRLDKDGLEQLRTPLQGLVAALKDGMPKGASLIKDLVLLAHWDAQSFFNENYTDLWDFCDCLSKRCTERKTELPETGGSAVTIAELEKIARLCDQVKLALVAENQEEGIVVHEDNSGSEFQFARGLSVYFPWCEPRDDQRAKFESHQKKTERPPTEETKKDQPPPGSKKVMATYKTYDFNDETQFGEHTWFTFLEKYFTNTKREALPGRSGARYDKAEESFFKGRPKRMPVGILKRTPEEGPDDCTCPTIKNYPITEWDNRNFTEFSITPGALDAFLPPKERVVARDGADAEEP